ncbi:hypothetical protein ISF_06612 [Cordyceps fumosorosea ARSEF 2679]|uniref:Glycine zipper 2TM domain-containing protein n=1 Tax=Cordyceps fumosorosea (strain ARSEF 2679) TaxID=1081104 RepID=A0A167RQF0_CORFA|nr:hypothetical protein ISF_06612 [Cordyceps fumosorosea ARSEF 2679]OAA58829.1 hypothetical protein ISF_06612 [Cordyceps fumosorosea ARSEF 2679]
MPRSNYDDDNDFRGGHGSRRNRSPDYYSGAGGGPAVGFGDPGRPFRDDAPYERDEMTLMPPAHNSARANSVPPGNALAYRNGSESPPYARSRGSHSRHSRSRSRYDDDDSSSSRDRRRRGSQSPMSRARHTVEDNFSNSSAGIGAGILGAVVGGFVANKATEAAYNRSGKDGHQRRHSDENKVPMAVSTLLGAVAGGLGANALAHHVEDKRRDRERPHRSRDDDSDYDDRRSRSRRDDYDDYDDRRRDDYRRHRD